MRRRSAARLAILLAAVALVGCEPSPAPAVEQVGLLTSQVQVRFAADGLSVVGDRVVVLVEGGNQTNNGESLSIDVSTQSIYGRMRRDTSVVGVGEARGTYLITADNTYHWTVDTLSFDGQLHFCAKPALSFTACVHTQNAPAEDLLDLQPDGQGHAIVLYRPLFGSAMQTLQLDGDGRWTSPLDVPGSAQASRDSGQLSVGNGVMLAVWQRQADSAVLANVFDSTAQEWLLPQTLAPASNAPPLLVRARPDSPGAVTSLALWSTPAGVEGALYHPQTGWQALDRAPDTAGAQVAAAAMSDDGTALVVWIDTHIGHARAARLVQGVWSATTDLGAARPRMRIAADGRGNYALVVADTGTRLRVHQYLAGDGWQAALPVADDAVVDDFDVAADRQGLTVIGYLKPVPEWIGSTQLALMALQLGLPPIHLSVALDNPGRVTSDPAAIDCPGRCSADFLQEQTVELTAAPVEGGGDFLGWSGSFGLYCEGTANPLRMKLTLGLGGNNGLAQSCNAMFGAPGTATLATLTLTVNGSGHITAPGIDCGSDCSETVSAGTRLTLTATPAAGYGSVVWGGDAGCGASVLLAADLHCTASFALLPTDATLTLAVAGVVMVLSDPPGIGCPGDCSEIYPLNTAVTLSAQPAPGTDVSWNGAPGCSGRALTVAVSMTADRACSATFTASPGGQEWRPLEAAPWDSATFAPAVATDSAGWPLVAHLYPLGEQNQLVVRRFDGVQWQVLDSPVNSDFSSAASPSLAVQSNGRPVLAWSENNHRIRVAEWDGLHWVDLADNLAMGGDSAIVAEPQLAVAGTEIVVVWMEVQGTSARLALKRMDRASSGPWAGDFIDGVGGGTGDLVPRLALQADGRATVLFAPGTANDGEGALRVVEQTGTGWQPLCGAVAEAGGHGYPNRTFGFGLYRGADGTAVVASVSNDAHRVITHSCNGTDWVPYGSVDGTVLVADDSTRVLKGVTLLPGGNGPTLAYALGTIVGVLRGSPGAWSALAPELLIARPTPTGTLAAALSTPSSPVVGLVLETNSNNGGIGNGVQLYRFYP